MTRCSDMARSLGRRLAAEDGSAVIELTWLGILLLVPLIYLVLMIARLQAGSYAVAQASREAGRAYITAPEAGSAEPRAQAAAALRAGTATTIGVVATDADLDKAGCSMLARVAHDGLARAVSPVHTAFDGDTFVGLSTRARGRPDPLTVVDLQTEAAHCVTRAVARALLAVTTLDRSGDAGEVLTAYRDLLRPADPQ